MEIVFDAFIGGRRVLVAQVGQLAIAFDGQHIYPALLCTETARSRVLSGAALNAHRLREVTHGS